MAYMAYTSSKAILEEELSASLLSIADRQALQINSLLKAKVNRAEAMSSLPQIVDLAMGLEKNSINPETARLLVKYQEAFDFVGIFLISPKGEVLFSNREAYQGKSLQSPELRKLEISRLYSSVNTIMEPETSDFTRLEGEDKPVAFIGVPIRKERKVVGVLALEIDNQDIQEVASNYLGLKQTGETVIAGKKGDQVFFTINTRFAANAALQQSVDAQNGQSPILEAVQGKRGSGIGIDYRGVEVLAAWSYIPALRNGMVVKIDVEEAFSPIQDLTQRLILIVGVCVILVTLVTVFVSQSLSRPIVELTKVTEKVAAGDLNQQVHLNDQTEIGRLANAFNQMIGKILAAQEELQEYNQTLEERVADRTKELEAKNRLVEEQRREIQDERNELSVMNEELNQLNEELQANIEKVEKQKKAIQTQNTNILASIQYAKRIQSAILPSPALLSFRLPNSFVLFKPRDIVSGDFYWCLQRNDKIVVAVIDCTGHGVPGAFMSVIGDTLLNQIVNVKGITDPAEILSQMDDGVMKALKKDDTFNQDSMDGAICTIDPMNNTIEYAGARNRLIYTQNGKLNVVQADRMSIGGMWYRNKLEERRFTKHTIKVESPMTCYLFSDGYRDQFGGPNDTKMTMKRFKKTLELIHDKEPKVQKNILNDQFLTWKGHHRQTDDVLVLGFKVGD